VEGEVGVFTDHAQAVAHAVVAAVTVFLGDGPGVAGDVFEGDAGTDQRDVVAQLLVGAAVEGALLWGSRAVAGEERAREVGRVALERDRVGIDAHEVAVLDHPGAAFLEVGEGVRAALQ